jgi:hypothetical protein
MARPGSAAAKRANHSIGGAAQLERMVRDKAQINRLAEGGRELTAAEWARKAAASEEGQ